MGAKFTLTNGTPLGDTAMKVVEMAMLEIWRDARSICPVDTGNLANSILPHGPQRQGTFGATATVGTDVYYGPFVEFGTKHMAAQPYLGPALAKAKAKYS